MGFRERASTGRCSTSTGIAACRRWCATATALYRAQRALHERDCEADGFRWIVVDDRDNSVFAWLRFGGDGAPPVVGRSPTSRPCRATATGSACRCPGRWREILNTDAGAYGGSNRGNAGGVDARRGECHGHPCSASVTLPPLATLWLVHEGGT